MKDFLQAADYINQYSRQSFDNMPMTAAQCLGPSRSPIRRAKLRSFIQGRPDSQHSKLSDPKLKLFSSDKQYISGLNQKSGDGTPKKRPLCHRDEVSLPEVKKSKPIQVLSAVSSADGTLSAVQKEDTKLSVLMAQIYEHPCLPRLRQSVEKFRIKWLQEYVASGEILRAQRQAHCILELLENMSKGIPSRVQDKIQKIERHPCLDIYLRDYGEDYLLTWIQESAMAGKHDEVEKYADQVLKTLRTIRRDVPMAVKEMCRLIEQHEKLPQFAYSIENESLNALRLAVAESRYDDAAQIAENIWAMLETLRVGFPPRAQVIMDQIEHHPRTAWLVRTNYGFYLRKMRRAAHAGNAEDVLYYGNYVLSLLSNLDMGPPSVLTRLQSTVYSNPSLHQVPHSARLRYQNAIREAMEAGDFGDCQYYTERLRRLMQTFTHPSSWFEIAPPTPSPSSPAAALPTSPMVSRKAERKEDGGNSYSSVEKLQPVFAEHFVDIPVSTPSVRTANTDKSYKLSPAATVRRARSDLASSWFSENINKHFDGIQDGDPEDVTTDANKHSIPTVVLNDHRARDFVRRS